MSIITGLVGKVTGLSFPWKLLAFLAILAGTFAYGHHMATVNVSAKYELKISKYETDANKLSAQLAAAQSLVEEKILIKYVTVIQTIEKDRIVYKNQAATEVPNQAQMSNGWVYLHDQAVLGLPADDSKVKDPTASGVQDNQALGVVVDNYGICRENTAQLQAYQEYNKQIQAYVNSIRKYLEKNNKTLSQH